MTHRLLDMTALIEATNLSRSTLYHLISTGEIESIKVGSRRLIPAESLDRFIESLKAANR